MLDAIMDTLYDTLETVADHMTEKVEETGRALARRGDALFGCEEYEHADFSDRMAGCLGLHDDTWMECRRKEYTGPAPGDVLCVSRGLYDHFGVYSDRDSIIHYTGNDTDLGGEIRETGMNRFLRGTSAYCVLVFPQTYGTPGRAHLKYPAVNLLPGHPDPLDMIIKLLRTAKYRLYSPEETVRRARSRLGEDRYSLLFNNCEHFALWCKTGISESRQVESLLRVVMKTQVLRV